MYLSMKFVCAIERGPVTCGFKFGTKRLEVVGLVSLEERYPEVSFLLALVTAMR